MSATASPLLEGFSYPTLKPLIKQSLKAKSTVLLRGNPGVGKSSLANEISDEFGMQMIDIRAAQKDPAEIGGVYIPNKELTAMKLLAPDWVDECCKNPRFLFLDEINAAIPKVMQAALYHIILEHRVGPFTFHPETVVMAAGNLEEDEALAVPMSSALQNRFRHFTMRVDATAWLRWASKAGLSPDIMAFIGFGREGKLYNRTGEYAWASPRSWADAAKIENMDVPEEQRQALVSSCVGSAMTKEFFTFLKVYRKVDVNAILQRGEIPTIDPERDLGFVYALTFSIGYLLRNMKTLSTSVLENLKKLFTTPGFRDEFQILLCKNIQDTKAFETIQKAPSFDAIKKRLTSLLTATD
jgi:hypothetical protein